MALEDIFAEGEKNSPFLRLKAGDNVTVKFLGVEKIKGYGGKETNEFTFEVDGIVKTMQAGFSLIRSMMEAGVKEGDTVKIKREGELLKTRYYAEKIQ